MANVRMVTLTGCTDDDKPFWFNEIPASRIQQVIDFMDSCGFNKLDYTDDPDPNNASQPFLDWLGIYMITNNCFIDAYQSGNFPLPETEVEEQIGECSRQNAAAQWLRDELGFAMS